MRKLLAFLLAALMLLTLAACSDDKAEEPKDEPVTAENLVGTWHSEFTLPGEAIADMQERLILSSAEYSDAGRQTILDAVHTIQFPDVLIRMDIKANSDGTMEDFLDPQSMNDLVAAFEPLLRVIIRVNLEEAAANSGVTVEEFAQQNLDLGVEEAIEQYVSNYGQSMKTDLVEKGYWELEGDVLYKWGNGTSREEAHGICCAMQNGNLVFTGLVDGAEPTNVVELALPVTLERVN